MSTVIKIENLSKKYVIGHQKQEKYTTLRDVMAHKIRGIGQRLRHPLSPNGEKTNLEEFWALKDINLEIKQGDRVGIIGRNGAGKSTLLKILSRITEPTKGRITINGRVASLLEVGTGFHPELTGRENIFLNGAILGMSRVEIKRKFEKIVDFAEVEKFLDTPVKRYSSGMYVRLAFAVAAHLEPEILIVDEVLAVGDMTFQQKCIGKMEDISKEGRSIIFVSHNMQAIRRLCNRGIVFDKGNIISNDTALKAVTAYTEQQRTIEFGPETEVHNRKYRRGSGAARFVKIELLDTNDKKTRSFMMGDTIRFALDFKIFTSIDHLYGSIVIKSDSTNEIITSVRHIISKRQLPAGYTGKVIIEFPKINLRPRSYILYFWLGNNMSRPFDVADDILPPIIIEDNNETKDPLSDELHIQGYFDIESNLHIIHKQHN